MSLLQSIVRGKQAKAPRILVYGIEGIGKTTLASNAPKPIFIPTEDGLDQIDCASFPLCRSHTDVMNCLNTLVREDHDFQTVILDSGDWAERLVWDHLCQTQKVKSIELVDGGYGKGYKRAAEVWRTEIVDALRRLRDQKGMAAIILAHAKIEKFTDPESGQFDRFSPKLHELANAVLIEWCDAILLATREFGAAKGDTGGGKRIMRCTPSAVGVAKNRYGFPDTLPLDWNAIMPYIAATYNNNESSKGELNNGNAKF